jgi:hypothetical protein
MDIYTIEIETARLQRERQREARLARELGALEPLPRERQRGAARRTAIALIGAALVTLALVAGVGQAATSDAASGSVQFTPYYPAGVISPAYAGADQVVDAVDYGFATGEAAR